MGTGVPCYGALETVRLLFIIYRQPVTECVTVTAIKQSLNLRL